MRFTLSSEPSASGRGRVQRTQFPLDNGRHFAPMHHFELLNHPDVYDQMRRWLAGRAAPYTAQCTINRSGLRR